MSPAAPAVKPPSPARKGGDHEPTPPAKQPFHRSRQLLLAGLKFLVGVVCCQGMLLSVLVVGWTQGRMRRVALKQWRTLDEEMRPRGFFGHLVATSLRGAAAAGNVFLATLPATGLWYVAWVLGWNVSFHKQYEQSHLGASLGWTGILIFALVMLYLPTALARQAVTGDWRAFWRLRENCRLVHHAAARQMLWVIVFAIAAGAVMVMRLVPYFYGASEEAAALTDAELVAWANRYYLFTAFFLLPAYVLLWSSAARTYAAAVVGATRRGFDPARLTPTERRATQLVVVTERAAGGRGLASRWLGRFGALSALGVTMLLWTTVAIQVFVAQFLHYIPAQGWLNHPLVLLPWLRYLPPGLGS